jgi:protein-S-isoprenylcysteine O-methyltransferase Ste14
MFIVMRGIILIISAFMLVCALGYLGSITLQDNLIGWFLILTAVAYGLGGPYLLWSNLKNEGIVSQERQDKSFWLILPGFLMVFYAPPIEYVYLSGIIPNTRLLQEIGLILIVTSLLLFTWARLVLKGMYSGRLRVKTDHSLVQQGPYHFIRHPAYTSYIIMSLGITIGFSSIIGLLAVPLLLLPGLIYRIRVEEKLLSLEFGNQYLQYARSTWHLFPGIW